MIEFQKRMVEQLDRLHITQDRYGHAIEEQIKKMNYLLEKLIDKLDTLQVPTKKLDTKKENNV